MPVPLKLDRNREWDAEGKGANRIAWKDWEPETFALAAAEGKLIFLDISASWCHWCHVLDRTSLSDPRVIRILNRSYVPVRVDTDRRPDVNDRYNQGGWPTTAVLLPDGRLLTGATYLPPDALFDVLKKCLEYARKNGSEILRGRLRGNDPRVGPDEDTVPDLPAGPRPEDLSLVTHSVLAQYDPANPGFFREPKFLMIEALALLRDGWAIEGNAEMGDIFRKILRTMGASDVYDPLDGGFFRYATKRDWSEPHFEKLLVDNADLLALYASAYELTGEPFFARVAEGTLRFMLTALHDPSTGAFFASRDADEDYYRITAEERACRIAPAVDRTIFSEYNGKTVSALLGAHRAFGRGAEIPAGGGESLLARAERLGYFLRTAMWSDEEGQIRYADGGTFHAGLLADNVFVATAYLDLWDATEKREYLVWAGMVLDWAVRHLFSPRRLGFLDRRPGTGEAGGLSAALVPFTANAQAAGALIRFARASSRPDLLAVAELVLKGLSGEYDKRSAFSAPYGSAMILYRKGEARGSCGPGDPSCADRNGAQPQ